MAHQDAGSLWEEQTLAALDAGAIDQALRVLVAGYGRAILAYCIARLGDEARAADVAQDVFVALCTALPGFRRESSLRTWIFAIVHHKCAQHQHRLWQFGRLFSAGSDPPEEAAQPDPADSPE